MHSLPDSLKQKKQAKKVLNTEMMPPKPVIDDKPSNEKPPIQNKQMQLLIPQILDMGSSSPTERQNKFKSIYNQNYN